MKALILVIILALSGCGSNKVPLNIVDETMVIAQANAQENAQAYTQVVYPNASRVVMYTDPTIGQYCRWGDGWASGMVFQGGQIIARIKCQTNGTGKGVYGCLTESDWQKEYGRFHTRTCNKDMEEIKRFR